MKLGKKRTAGIQQLLETRGGCTCAIRAEMTDDELQGVKSCTPLWVCATLDRIRRIYVEYGRHYEDGDKNEANEASEP